MRPDAQPHRYSTRGGRDLDGGLGRLTELDIYYEHRLLDPAVHRSLQIDAQGALLPRPTRRPVATASNTATPGDSHNGGTNRKRSGTPSAAIHSTGNQGPTRLSQAPSSQYQRTARHNDTSAIAPPRSVPSMRTPGHASARRLVILSTYCGLTRKNRARRDVGYRGTYPHSLERAEW